MHSPIPAHQHVSVKFYLDGTPGMTPGTFSRTSKTFSPGPQGLGANPPPQMLLLLALQLQLGWVIKSHHRVKASL